MCKCQNCGKFYKIDLIVPDKLWGKITPNIKHPWAGLLCSSCIMQKLEEISDYNTYELREIK